MTDLDSGIGEASAPKRARLTAVMFFVAVLAASVAHWPLFRVSGIPIQWVDAAVVLIYLALCLECVQARKLPNIDPLIVPTAIFVATLAVSCVGAPHPLRSALKLVGFGPYLLLPVLGAALLQTREDIRLVSRAWWLSLLFTLVVCFATIVVFYSNRQVAAKYLMRGYGGLPSLPIPRLCAPLANPNALFNHLLTALCIFVATGYTRFFGTKSTLVAYGLVVAFAAFTASAGLAGLAVSTALLLAWATRGQTGPLLRTLRWVATGGAALAVVVVTLSMSGGLVEPEAGDIHVAGVGYAFGEAARPPIWRAALKSFAAHPAFGLGYGEAPGLTNDPRAWRVHDEWTLPHDGSFHAMDGHNAWLNVAGQAGIVGVLAFAGLVGALWLRLQRARGQLRHLPLTLSDGLAALLAGWFVHSFFGSFEEARELWLVFAMVIAVCKQASTPRIELERAAGSPSD